MKTFKLTTTILLTLFATVVPLIGQVDEPTEPELYTYYIPFSESTYSGAWSFTLEAAGQDDEPAQIALQGYSAGGAEVFNEARQIDPNKVFVWRSADAAYNKRFQSLVLSANKPLTGILWMTNESDGIFNGVALGADKDAGYLIAPHIPNDKYTWLTSVSVFGVDKGASGSALHFRRFNPDGVANEGQIRSNLRNGGWYSGRPYRNIIFGNPEDDERAHWGIIFTDSSNFTLAGYQTFQRLSDENPISCAMELRPGEGSPAGMIGFSVHAEINFSEWFAFTNPNDEAVDVRFELSYMPPEAPKTGDAEDVAEEPESATQTLVKIVRLEPRQRVVDVLGLTFFEELDGQPYILRYHATALDPEVEGEDPMPLPILAMHLQANVEQTMLGGHQFVESAGHISYTWVDLDGPETVIDIFNPTNDRARVSATLTDAEGNKLLTLEQLDMDPNGASLGLSNFSLKALLEAEAIEVDTSQPLRLTIKLKNGKGVFTKITRVSRDAEGNLRDFAVLNGTMVTPETDVPFRP